jgi:hypothetical protein
MVWLNGKNYFVQIITSVVQTTYAGNVSFEGLPKSMTYSEVALTEKPNVEGQKDIVLGHISISKATTKDAAEKVNAAMESWDDGKTLVGCTVSAAYAACLIGTAEAPQGAEVCETEFDGPLNIGAAACFSGISDYVIDAIFGSTASKFVGLASSVKQKKFKEAVKSALAIGVQISNNVNEKTPLPATSENGSNSPGSGKTAGANPNHPQTPTSNPASQQPSATTAHPEHGGDQIDNRPTTKPPDAPTQPSHPDNHPQRPDPPERFNRQDYPRHLDGVPDDKPGLAVIGTTDKDLRLLDVFLADASNAVIVNGSLSRSLNDAAQVGKTAANVFRNYFGYKTVLEDTPYQINKIGNFWVVNGTGRRHIAVVFNDVTGSILHIGTLKSN